ncbi:hypothetical protein D3C71_1557160 [compost metagenome]
MVTAWRSAPPRVKSHRRLSRKAVLATKGSPTSSPGCVSAATCRAMAGGATSSCLNAPILRACRPVSASQPTRIASSMLPVMRFSVWSLMMVSTLQAGKRCMKAMMAGTTTPTP